MVGLHIAVLFEVCARGVAGDATEFVQMHIGTREAQASECEVTLYEHWHESKGETGNTKSLKGTGDHRLGDFAVTSSVKVTGEGCVAYGYTNADCTGEKGQGIKWNAQVEDSPTGSVTPSHNLEKHWGCNDCTKCVKVEQTAGNQDAPQLEPADTAQDAAQAQPTAAPTTSPTPTPTTATPVPTNGAQPATWIKGGLNEDCTTACEKQGRTCDESAWNVDQAAYKSVTDAISCSRSETMCQLPFQPLVLNGAICQFHSCPNLWGDRCGLKHASLLDASIDPIQSTIRICPCNSQPAAAKKKTWKQGNLGESCTAACERLGGKCSENAWETFYKADESRFGLTGIAILESGMSCSTTMSSAECFTGNALNRSDTMPHMEPGINNFCVSSTGCEPGGKCDKTAANIARMCPCTVD